MKKNRSTINKDLLESSKEDLSGWVGTSVYKMSGKPFKSGSKINTVKAVIDHPRIGVPAFEFAEDDSVVEARRCKMAERVGHKLTLMSAYGEFSRPWLSDK